MNQTSYFPVFILSCERSGSTMLRYIVDTHSQIACPSHLYLGSLCKSLNTVLIGTLAQNQHDLTEEEKKQFVISETRAMIINIMAQYISAKNKPIWCEKTPMNLDYLALLETHFPDAKYICLYRHCMDVVHSSINLSKLKFLPEHIPYVHRNPDSIIAAMTENWLDKTQRLLAFEKKHLSQCFRVRYEDIVTQPENSLTELFEFLGVSLEDDLITKVFQTQHDKGEGDGRATLSTKISTDSLGKGIEVPKTGIPYKFIPTVNALLKQLHYPDLDSYYSNSFSSLSRTDTDKNKTADIFENQFAKAIKYYQITYPQLKGIWKIIIKGHIEQVWVLDLSGDEGLIKNGDAPADYTLSFSEGLLFEMLNKTRDADEAFSQGEIQIESYDSDIAEKMICLAKLLRL
jgi:protein-tyrosine sulfotransferase